MKIVSLHSRFLRRQLPNVAILFLTAQAAHAATSTWKNTGTDFNTAGNWTNGLPTAGNAVFDTAAITQPNLSASFTTVELNFSTAASSGYDITTSGTGISLTLTSASGGAFGAINAANTSGTNTIDAPLILGSTATPTFNQVAGGTLVVNGVISTTGTLTLGGGGTIKLTGANTYSGGTILSSATIQVTSLGNAGANGSLGTGGISTALFSITPTVNYIGAGETSNKSITLAGTNGGFIIDTTGATGALILTSDFTDTATGTKLITLTGNNAGNALQGKIVNGGGATSVTKSGAGTWTLSGSNTYTGATTISAGTLVINTTASAGNSGTGLGNVNVTGGTLGGTGIIQPGSGNKITVSSGAFLAPGDSTTGNGIGTLTLDGVGTAAALLTLNGGAKFSFQLGAGLSSDKINLWNYAGAADFVRNSNVIDIALLASATTGTYNLFNFYSDNGSTLTALGFSTGLTVNFLNGSATGSLDYTTPGQINLVVTAVPEPSSWLLVAGGLSFAMFFCRRRALRN